ncbi:MAG: hypothetical protein ACPG4T_08180 [Nannocystaceae bacterium]
MSAPLDWRQTGQFFTRLGQAVDRAWTTAGRHSSVFSRIAVDEIQKARPQDHVGLPGLLEMLSRCWSFPQQDNGPWGDPPVTVYHEGDFFIDVYFFRRPASGIHDHHTSGAFTTLHGVSLHTLFTFEEHRRLARGIGVGELKRTGFELLHPGVARRIEPGRALVHHVGHSSCPTVSMVVRTSGSESQVDVHAYHRPGLALWSIDRLTRTARVKLRLMQSMAGWRDPAFESRVAQMLRNSPPLEASWLAHQAFGLTRDLDVLRAALPQGADDKPWVDAVLAAAAARSSVPRGVPIGEGERAVLGEVANELLRNSEDVERVLDDYDDYVGEGPAHAR